LTKLRISLLVILSVASLVSFSFTAWAICTNRCVTGWNDCNAWCDAHCDDAHCSGTANAKAASLSKCRNICEAYWNSGKNPQSSQIGLGDPTNPPQKIGPGRVKNPPTSVGGLPNPTPGKGPQEGDHPVKSNPTPTPKPGKGRGGISGLPKSSPTPTPSTR